MSTTGLTLPAENIFTKCRGYVNASDVTDKHERSFILTAFRDIKRDKAVSLLSQPEVETGNFILCSESANNGLALMIRTDNKPFVKVYEIHPNKSNQYCIEGQFPFDRLTDLIEHCSANPIDSAYNRLIPYGEFPTLKEIITEGHFTHVYHGTFKSKEVVVKNLKPESPISTLLRDIQYLKSVNHPVCVRTLEITYQWTSVSSTMIMIIMDPFEGITLKEFFSCAGFYSLKLNDLLKMYTEVRNYVPPGNLRKFIQSGNYPNSSKKEFTNILPVLKFCWQICPKERQTFAQITKWLRKEEF
ncbi:unnamed protein product [Rodentolepis nana]|uniref:Tyrosine-protein kinase n=1 Tax=Rodentolepis nana TaxID=102285 RepID=A0A3P7SQ20_RODNA|nr:unnamed protein product [Rodentolepis nana]